MHSVLILILGAFCLFVPTHTRAAQSHVGPKTRTLQICQTDTDCTVGPCADDGQCGVVNGDPCVADVECREGLCAADGRCGKPNGLDCISEQDCRSNICNADGFCGYLQIALCANANQCRSNVCVSGYCYPECSQDSDCDPGTTFCNTDTKRCEAKRKNNTTCLRDAMCQSTVCAADGFCGAPYAEPCTASAQCRSQACISGFCAQSCMIDSQCADGLYCDSQKVCRPQATSGQSCLRAAMCASGVCGSDGICGNINGAHCQSPQDCRSGICNSETLRCQTSCQVHRDCDYAHFCDATHACAPLLHNGAACTESKQCEAGVCNSDDTCGQQNGAPCGQDATCLGLACQMESTTCGLAQGFACSDAAACLTGFCDATHVCASCRNDLDCVWGQCEQGLCVNTSTLERVELTGGGCEQVRGKTHASWWQPLIVFATFFLARRRQRARRSPWDGLFLGLWFIVWPLSAQATGFALERYTPSDPGQYTVRVERPRYGQKHQPRLVAGVHLGVAHNPLKYHKRFVDPKADIEGGLVSSQLVGSLQVAGSWLDWLALSAYVPLMLHETGQSALGVDVHSPSMGNMQLQGMVRLFGHSDTDKVSAHAGLALVLPAGQNSHAHDGMPGAIPKAVLSGRILPMLGYSANVGFWIRESSSLTTSTSLFSDASNPMPNVVTARAGSEFQLGFAAFYVHDVLRWSVGPELNYTTQISTSVAGRRQGSSLELLLGTTGAWDANFGGSFAIGMGFLGQAGTPDWRILARFFWAPWGNDNAYSKPKPRDRDHDGIEDSKDACPDVFGVFSPDPENNGCPGDRDHDGIVDHEDKCPNQPAGLRPDPQRRGCPMPTVQDQAVAPTEAKDTTKVVWTPVHITHVHDTLSLSRPIGFIDRTAKLTEDGLFVIQALADYLHSHPQIRHITIHAYTDDVEQVSPSQILSQRRANMVKDALMQKHIDPQRMVPKGHGQAQPIAPNTTVWGRAANMRLEIKIDR